MAPELLLVALGAGALGSAVGALIVGALAAGARTRETKAWQLFDGEDSPADAVPIETARRRRASAAGSTPPRY